MFVQETFEATLREPLLVPGSELLVVRPVDQDSGGVSVVIASANRTAGSVTVALFGSLTGVAGSFFALGSDLTTVVTVNDSYYIFVNGPVPPYLGVQLVPAGGYDGRVGVLFRSAGQINQTLPPVSL